MFQAALRYLTSGRPPWGREQDDALQETKSEENIFSENYALETIALNILRFFLSL